ncbi:MAG TPA: serine hydrolase [Ktedonobacteraceae bacterium]|nr:serine hydrolase [Ktedonobacteraceae bacterium]
MHNLKRTHRHPLHRLLVVLAAGLGIILLAVFSAGRFTTTRSYAWTSSRQIAEQHSARQHKLIQQQPHNKPELNTIDKLSPELAAYLAKLGPDAGLEVYDITHQRVYAYNGNTAFLTASSIKVPIMLAFFAMTENQGREPDHDEMQLLTAMIEHSDNDAASALFKDIGNATGLANYLQQIGVKGLEPENGTWGYSQITPQAMINLLTQLHNGSILTAADRATALSWMQHVEAEQQWGVGDTAPAGATFAMKNGWVPGPDGLWSVNTSGIVEAGKITYLISVYTREQPSLKAGQAIVQQVCSSVAASLA